MSNDDKQLERALDALIKQSGSAEEVFSQLRQLKKRALERMLEAEMDEHLGYEKHAAEGYDGGNSRNGHSRKKVITDDGEVAISVPRDRESSFEPQLVAKGQRRLKGFDDKVIALYARGMSTRDIRDHVQEIYEVEIQPSLVSRITDNLIEEAQAWQNRTLKAVYPIVYFDGLRVKVRRDGRVENLVVYVVFAINMRGMKEVLGFWFAGTEGAKFWLNVLTELRSRGVEDILFACVDGLKGFPEAFDASFPRTTVQTCIVHMIRNSTRLVAWKNRRAVAKDLRPIYTAPTEAAALQALEQFEGVWGKTYPSIGASWHRNWETLSPFFSYSAVLRRAIYTTNPVEALNRQLRKVLKTRGAFPTETALLKVLWLNVDRTSRKWTYPRQGWDLVVQQLAIQFGDRVPVEDYADA